MKMRNYQSQEILSSDHDQFICWKSIFGGLLISIMGYMILSALGVGIWGGVASNLISNEENGSSLATGAALWIALSAVVSLFLGSYFTLRTSNFVTNRIGAAHGFIMSSIFFILMISVAGSTVGSVSMGIGKMVSGIGKGAANLSTNPAIQDTVEKALGNANLRSEPQVVAQGLAIRLLQGDLTSAKNYLGYQTNMSTDDIETKVNQLKIDFDDTAKTVGEKAAMVVSNTGWSLFITFLVGLIAAMFGGRLGAQANCERPLYKDVKMAFNQSIPQGV